MAKAITKKEQAFLDPKWLCDTAKLAMKRGTSIIFAKNRLVYGIMPKSGGGVNVYYEGNTEWIDAVLGMFPEGAVFPNDNVFGGPATSKALRAYANIALPTGDEPGKAWIDPITFAMHVKGRGTTIHSATIGGNETPVSAPPSKIPNISLSESLTKDIGKLLTDATSRDDNRPFLKRVHRFEHDGDVYLAASNGRFAAMHKCDEVPVGFSFDPTLVSLFDIVGFATSKSDKNSLITVRHYRMIDGTVLSESITDATLPAFSVILGGAVAANKDVVMSGAQTAALVEEIASLGLGSTDKNGGVLIFSSGRTEMMAENQPVAEFDTCSQLGEGSKLYMAFPVIAKLARLGGDFAVCEGGKPCFAQAGSTTLIAMPIQLV